MSSLLYNLTQEAAKATRAAAVRPAGESSSGEHVPSRGGAPRPLSAPTPAPAQPARSRTPSVTVGADGLSRCPWSTAYAGAGSDAYVAYHDREWGRPKRDRRELFELLVLEGAQAGLSWSTILAKRDAYRRAFAGFDPERVAAFTDDDVEQLMAPDSGIVRHRGKIVSAVNNARCILELQRQHGSFSDWIWAFAGPGGRPIVNETAGSERLAAALKAAGFTFVGPTTAYSFMQAAGLVNDHLVSCFCHGEASDEGGGEGSGRREEGAV